MEIKERINFFWLKSRMRKDEDSRGAKASLARDLNQRANSVTVCWRQLLPVTSGDEGLGYKQRGFPAYN